MGTSSSRASIQELRPLALAAPREREELADQLRHPCWALLSMVSIRRRFLSSSVPSRSSSEPMRIGARIFVEIVRHAAGEHADAVEPAGPQQLRFQAGFFRDVGVDEQDGARLALVGEDEAPRALNLG